MTFDGRALAADILARIAARVAEFAEPPRVAVIATDGTAVTRAYMRVKERAAREAGCAFEVIELPAVTTVEQLRLAVDSANAGAIVVQLPLPEGVSAKEVCDAIPPEKDADVLGTVSRMRFEADEEDALVPPVAGALAEILAAGGIDPREKRAVVLGDGWLVGKPCATWLAHAGATVIHTHDFSELRLADIIVSGLGAPHAITPDLVKEGAVLVDAGTSELGGKLAGDADPACANKCALFTPVPGGVGPVAVAKLFDNVATLAERAIKL